MRIFPWAAAVFIAVPIIEIFLLLEVGSIIGVLPTIALVIITAVVGVNLLRAQGFQTMNRFQQEIATGQMPAVTMMEGAALLFGGALLLTPGFMTDTVGFLCLIPFTRRTIIFWLLKRIPMQSSGFSVYSSQSYQSGSNNFQQGHSRQNHSQQDVIEGEFEPRDNNNDFRNGR